MMERDELEREYEEELEKIKMDNQRAARQELFKETVCSEEEMEKYTKELMQLEKRHLKKQNELRKKYNMKRIPQEKAASPSPASKVIQKLILKESIGQIDPRDDAFRTSYKF
jgi:uncharacterized membrane-anchored protein YjiN (DUF445 family)